MCGYCTRPPAANMQIHANHTLAWTACKVPLSNSNMHDRGGCGVSKLETRLRNQFRRGPSFLRAQASRTPLAHCKQSHAANQNIGCRSFPLGFPLRLHPLRLCGKVHRMVCPLVCVSAQELEWSSSKTTPRGGRWRTRIHACSCTPA